MSGPGGWIPEELVYPEVTEICMKVKPDIEKKLKTTFERYIPLSFRRQTVAGTNYLVKVVVDVDKCFHAFIFAALGGKLTVLGVQFPKTLRDPLVPF